jgi:anthranilate phosphoribosyltransferase
MQAGHQRAMVVHGLDSDGQKDMDEISTIGPTVVEEFFPDGSRPSYPAWSLKIWV